MIDCNTYRWGDNIETIGPLGIDYLYLDTCIAPSLHYLIITVMLIWILYLIKLLASTASKYFSVTLGLICSNLKIPYDIAGITFLAFGNGAPDFFSLIASVSRGIDITVSSNGLLGGCIFNCTVVIGTISILCPSYVSSRIFIRDIIFYLIAMTLFIIIYMISDQITLIWGIVLITVYVIYINVVLFAPYLYKLYKRLYKKIKNKDSNNIDITNVTTSDESPTAFWHSDVLDNSTSNDNLLKDMKVNINSVSTTATVPETIINNNSYSKINTNYTDEESVMNNNKMVELTEITDANNNTDNNTDDSPISNQYRSDNDGEVEASSPFGSALVIDDFFTNESKADQSSMLHTSLIANSSNKSNSYEYIDDNNTDDVTDKIKEISQLKNNNNNKYRSKLMPMYWYQWLLRNNSNNNTDNYNDIMSVALLVLYYIELPITILRNMSIPTLDNKKWNKKYALLHPITDLLLISYLLELLHDNIIITLLIIIIISSIPTGYIYFFTHTSNPPSNVYITSIRIVVSFIMNVTWIYFIASELITVITALGITISIPPGFLGLTLLAWGNGSGEYFTNISIAKQGLGEMAIAGCYGAPIFDILISLGITLIIGSVKNYPDYYDANFNISCIISLLFIYIILIITIIVVSTRNFIMDKYLGIILIAIYIIYIISQITIAWVIL